MKPFDLEELTARIYALARRNARHAQNDIHVGSSYSSLPQRTVKRDGETIIDGKRIRPLILFSKVTKTSYYPVNKF